MERYTLEQFEDLFGEMSLEDIDAYVLCNHGVVVECGSDQVYRAVVWMRDDGQAELRLTHPGQAHLPDDELLAAARTTAAETGLDPTGGSYVICAWTG